MNNTDSKHGGLSLIDEIERYIKLRVRLFKIKGIEKTSIIMSMMIMSFSLILALFGAFLFFSFGLSIVFTNLFDNQILGLFMVGLLYLLLIPIIYGFRSRLFINPIVSLLSKLVFESNKQKENKDGKSEIN